MYVQCIRRQCDVIFLALLFVSPDFKTMYGHRDSSSSPSRSRKVYVVSVTAMSSRRFQARPALSWPHSLPHIRTRTVRRRRSSSSPRMHTRIQRRWFYSRSFLPGQASSSSASLVFKYGYAAADVLLLPCHACKHIHIRCRWFSRFAGWPSRVLFL